MASEFDSIREQVMQDIAKRTTVKVNLHDLTCLQAAARVFASTLPAGSQRDEILSVVEATQDFELGDV